MGALLAAAAVVAAQAASVAPSATIPRTRILLIPGPSGVQAQPEGEGNSERAKAAVRAFGSSAGGAFRERPGHHVDGRAAPGLTAPEMASLLTERKIFSQFKSA
jgi:hypothetical protein